MKRLRAVVFAPYLHTLGGGERVIVAAAQLLTHEYDVQFGAPRPVDRDRWQRLGFPPVLEVRPMNAREFTRATIGADLAVTMTNHVPLPSFARRSLLVVQFPTDRICTGNILRRAGSRWSLGRYHLLAYSDFSARHIADRWGQRPVSVLPPAVRQFGFDPGSKTNTILSVGRFATSGNLKRQDVLLEAWRGLKHHLPDWRLVLVGGGSKNDPYVSRILATAAEIGSVDVHVDATASRIDECYRAASIYWHAAGFERAVDDPAAAEHFGMSTVEAMSAGAVPIVFPDGGQTEIVTSDVGRQWSTVAELIDITLTLARSPEQRVVLAAAAHSAAGRYSAERFERGLLEAAGVGRLSEVP